ncbi:hypothetical protein TELCIR_07557, partial [Teladorsagia circumcincta]
MSYPPSQTWSGKSGWSCELRQNPIVHHVRFTITVNANITTIVLVGRLEKEVRYYLCTSRTYDQPFLGLDGEDGVHGESGAPGLPGAPGVLPEALYQHIDGCMICPYGPKGKQGEPGPPGPQVCALQLTSVPRQVSDCSTLLEKGFSPVNSEFQQENSGKPGFAGKDGQNGIPGSNGSPGEDGPTGASGEPGRE